jgi:tetratricopeptide (TPR) repeat protein
MTRGTLFKILVFLPCLSLVLRLVGVPVALGADLTAIAVGTDPYTVSIVLTDASPYKVVQFDQTEILVAFKDTRAPENLVPTGDGGPFIRQVRIAQRQRDIVSLIIKTESDIGSLSARWIADRNVLQVSLAPADVRPREPKGKKVRKLSRTRADQPAVADSKTPMPTPSPDSDTLPPAPPNVRSGEGTSPAPVIEEEIGFALGGRNFDNRYSGSTQDLFLELRSDACEELADVKRAVLLCNQGSWIRGFEIFNRYADDRNLSVGCLENVMIMRAFSFFKGLGDGDTRGFFEAAGYFQDLLAYFPNSIYTPYALTGLGKIYGHLGDPIRAEGYFKVVLKQHVHYPGTPEVMFELGRIYLDRGESKMAVEMLRSVVTQFPHGTFIGQAKLQLGKALFQMNDFHGCVKVLAELADTRPRMIFETPDLLQYLGNAYYHTGQSEKARQALGRVYNLFPDLPGKDTLLTRIGDTLVENKQKEKAIAIFQRVVDMFPGTDGFVISSMRLAEFLESREDKEKMYNMVIDDFSDNPLARLALMRLALLQNEAGEYEKSVETVKRLLATQPRALKRDAVNLMQESSERIFQRLLEKDEYTELLSRFETDKRIFDEAENPNLFLLVGMAYLKAHLHDNAVDMLLKAYKRTGEKKRPADLIYALSVAMDEAGRVDEALEMFNTYLKYFPDTPEVQDVYARMGNAYFEKKQYKDAVDRYKKALARGGERSVRARVLVHMSRCHTAMKDHATAVGALIQGINLLAGEPKESFDTLALAHRYLGENYMALEAWDKAADALAMSVKFSGTEDDTTEIHFMMGEAHQNNRNFDEAEKAYTIVVETGDSFWSSMAKERLRSMKLKVKLENT